MISQGWYTQKSWIKMKNGTPYMNKLRDHESSIDLTLLGQNYKKLKLYSSTYKDLKSVCWCHSHIGINQDKALASHSTARRQCRGASCWDSASSDTRVWGAQKWWFVSNEWNPNLSQVMSNSSFKSNFLSLCHDHPILEPSPSKPTTAQLGDPPTPKSSLPPQSL
jgi:hypothetical protein